MVKIIQGVMDPEYIKSFAKQMLKNTIFIGTFHEKRFVECLNSYRDVVSISNDETDFIQNLVTVKKRIESECNKLLWIGITDPHGVGTPAGYNLWVELPIGVFGQYWFKVKTVEFCKDQISLKLDMIRPVKNEKSTSGNMSIDDTFNDLSFSTFLPKMQFLMKNNVWHFCKNTLTTENIKTVIIFISVLLSTLMLSSIDMAKYLLEYLLKLVKELSKLIEALTPVMINLINLCGRIIFGLFQLIATLFKRHPPPQPVYNAYVNYDPINGMPNSVFDKNFPRALPNVSSRSRATIRPIY